MSFLSKRMAKFKPGNRTIQFLQEERIFLLKWARTLKPETEIEKRIVRRFLWRLLGETIYYPLYPPKECPVCEREVAGSIFDRHLILCKSKKQREKRRPKIDPVVLEMMDLRIAFPASQRIDE